MPLAKQSESKLAAEEVYLRGTAAPSADRSHCAPRRVRGTSVHMSSSTRFAATSALALLTLAWVACGGKVVVDATQASAAGGGGSASSSSSSGGAGGSGGVMESSGVGDAGACDLCNMPSSCQNSQDCCGGGCLGGNCFFSPPAGLFCCTDDACAMGTTCDITIHACRGCTSDAMCFGAAPTCDADAGLCH